MLRLMWHGTNADPTPIVLGETGLDFRLAPAGPYGLGSLFANNAAHSIG